MTMSAAGSILLTCPSLEAGRALYQLAAGGGSDPDGRQEPEDEVAVSRGRRNRDPVSDDGEEGGGSVGGASGAGRHSVLFYNGQQLVVTRGSYETRIKPLLPLRGGGL